MFTSKPSSLGHLGTMSGSLGSDIEVFYTWNQGITTWNQGITKKDATSVGNGSVHFGNQWIFERPNFETNPKCDVRGASLFLSSSKFTRYDLWGSRFLSSFPEACRTCSKMPLKSTSGFTKNTESNQHISRNYKIFSSIPLFLN